MYTVKVSSHQGICVQSEYPPPLPGKRVCVFGSCQWYVQEAVSVASGSVSWGDTDLQCTTTSRQHQRPVSWHFVPKSSHKPRLSTDLTPCISLCISKLNHFSLDKNNWLASLVVCNFNMIGLVNASKPVCALKMAVLYIQSCQSS